MANSVISQFLLDAQSVAQNCPGMLPGNVLIGQVEFVARDNAFYQHVADTGYVLVLGMPKISTSDTLTQNSQFELEAELFFPIPADVNYDMVPVYNQLMMLWTGWATNEPWYAGQNRAALRMKCAKPERRFHEKPFGQFLKQESFICTIRINFTMPFITDQGAAPYLQPPGGIL